MSGVPPPPPPQPKPRTRPIVASIIAILIMVGGILIILLGLVLLVLGPIIGFGLGGGTGLLVGAALGGIVFLIGLLVFLIGLGLWRLRSWALWLVGLVTALWAIAAIATSNVLCSIGVIIPVLLLIYFIAVRRNFD
jgi:hypothetical protein